MMNVIYSAAAAGSVSNIHLSDETTGIILLIAGLVFFFALDIVYVVTGLSKDYKRPKMDPFRILGIFELVLGSIFLLKSIL